MKMSNYIWRYLIDFVILVHLACIMDKTDFNQLFKNKITIISISRKYFHPYCRAATIRGILKKGDFHYFH